MGSAPIADFDCTIALFTRAFLAGNALPHSVFASDIAKFGFLEFSEMPGQQFWCLIRHLSAWSGDSIVRIVSTDPSAEQLRKKGFGTAGTATANVAMDATQYYQLLAGHVRNQQNVGFDLLATPGIAFLPNSQDWGVWGERMLSTMVVGFRREPPKPFAELAHECGLRPQTMDEILDLTRLDFGIGYSKPPKPEWVEKYERYCAEFRRNYSR